MSEKLIPCACCGAAPTSFEDKEIVYYFCGCKACFTGYCTKPFLRTDWNNFMEHLIKRREKDYKAGFSQGYRKVNSFDPIRPIDEYFQEYLAMEQSGHTNGWIKSSSFRPSWGRPVLMLTDEGEILTGLAIEENWLYTWPDNPKGTLLQGTEVTHWMPLPKKPYE